MNFNDTSTGTGACQEIDDICNSDVNSYPIKSKTRRINAALDRFFTLAFQAAGRWSWDDPNWDTTPIQSINLVANTQSYNLDDFTSEIINVLRWEAKDSSGNNIVLRRLDRSTLGWGTALTNYQTTAGIPNQYDLVGEYIFLYPKPSYNSTNGLTVYMERNKSAFLYTDTTKALPVPSIFVSYICRLASLPHLIETQKAQKNDVAAQIQIDEEAIIDYFSSRNKSVNTTIQTINRNPR
jgi:hypothetical protein